MNQFNLNNFINKLANTPLQNGQGRNIPNAPGNPDTEFQIIQQQEMLAQNIIKRAAAQESGSKYLFNSTMINDLRMNSLANMEQSLYVKDLMKLPKSLEEVLVLIQNNAAQMEETSQVLTKNINLSVLAELIQTGGKEAMNKLVMVMAEAAKQGLTDTSQIKEAIKFINASVSVAAKEEPNQILKTFMLLYLPWIPLQEGVDFDLEIEASGGEDPGEELSITIMISTRNYGNVRATLVLLQGNSMSIIINCIEDFPKEELLKRLKEENKTHSIQSDITFSEQKTMQQTQTDKPQAKVSMSNLIDVNPFLLLMANAVIRHTIALDNEAG